MKIRLRIFLTSFSNINKRIIIEPRHEVQTEWNGTLHLLVYYKKKSVLPANATSAICEFCQQETENHHIRSVYIR